jgi:OOP family OmpA-OmpF porin
MKFFGMKQFGCLMLTLLLAGCSASTLNSLGPDEQHSSSQLIDRLKSGDYLQKTDNIIVIVDALGTSYDKYKSVPKIDIARQTLANMSDTIPPITHSRALRVFGWEAESFKKDFILSFGLLENPPESIPGIITTRTLPDSHISPLAMTFDNVALELKGVEGTAALVVMSDGINVNDNALVSAQKLKKQYGDSVCIYTILLSDDLEGARNMGALAQIGQCGFASRAEALNSQTAMTDFVEKVFFEKMPPVAMEPVYKEPVDIKKMPKVLPKDKTVSIELNVEFDFDKSDIKPEFHEEINKVAEFMKIYPFTEASLEGHTDSMGSHEYNDKLSLRRVTSVRTYLVEKLGIPAERLSVQGFGERKPVATNSTEEGRQKNRRVVAVIKAVMKEYNFK